VISRLLKDDDHANVKRGEQMAANGSPSPNGHETVSTAAEDELVKLSENDPMPPSLSEHILRAQGVLGRVVNESYVSFYQICSCASRCLSSIVCSLFLSTGFAVLMVDRSQQRIGIRCAK